MLADEAGESSDIEYLFPLYSERGKFEESAGVL